MKNRNFWKNLAFVFVAFLIIAVMGAAVYAISVAWRKSSSPNIDRRQESDGRMTVVSIQRLSDDGRVLIIYVLKDKQTNKEFIVCSGASSITPVVAAP